MNHIKKYLIPFIHEEHGATAIEFGMISMIFITFVFGVMEAGRVMWTYNALQYGVENAARYALVNEDASESEILAVATTSMTDMHVSDSSFSGTALVEEQGGKDFIKITGSYTYNPAIIGFLPASWTNIDLQANVSQPLNFVEEEE
jgi:Flp pilus assembly protein TadG